MEINSGKVHFGYIERSPTGSNDRSLSGYHSGYSKLLDISSDAIAIFDKNYKLKYFNQKWSFDMKSFFNHHPVIGKHLDDFIDKQFATEITAIKRNIKFCFETGETTKGENKKLEFFFYPVKNYAEQVTEVCHVAKQLQTASPSLRTKKLNHEILNPLNAILGYAQLAELEFKRIHGTDGDTELAHYMQHIGELVQNITNIIEDHKNPQEEDVKITITRPLIENIVQDVLLVHRVRVKFIIEIEEFEIRMNITKFRQILFNLVSNATKYNFNDGYVKIITNKRHRMLQITDSGEGIRDLDQLFSPKRQTQRQDIKGSGLGLVNVKHILDAHEVGIRIKSKVFQNLPTPSPMSRSNSHEDFIPNIKDPGRQSSSSSDNSPKNLRSPYAMDQIPETFIIPDFQEQPNGTQIELIFPEI